MIRFSQQRRRIVLGPVASLLIAAVVLLSGGSFQFDPFRSSSRCSNHGSGFRGIWTGKSEAEPSISPISRENPAASPVLGHWPPQLDTFYPDLNLCDQSGRKFRLSDLAGKVILLELVAIPCKGCQAFAGGHQHGSFAGVGVQKGLRSIHHYVREFAGIDLDENEDVVLVQLVLYGSSMRNPTKTEVRKWAKHFDMKPQRDEIVLQADRSMLSPATYDMIPGFHLIDRDFVLRYDSSGHHPTHDLYRELLPALGRMAR